MPAATILNAAQVTWSFLVYISRVNKKHLDARVKERPQTLLVPSEQICKFRDL